jgi:hypothetical protein
MEGGAEDHTEAHASGSPVWRRKAAMRRLRRVDRKTMRKVRSPANGAKVR